MSSLDPDLIGIWILPGKPQTYEVLADGSYHVADREESLSFEDNAQPCLGSASAYAARRFRQNTHWPMARADSQDEWQFNADGSYSVTGQGNTDTGIWALRSGGSALWTRELNAHLDTNGAQVTFNAVNGNSVTFGYTVADGV